MEKENFLIAILTIAFVLTIVWMASAYWGIFSNQDMSREFLLNEFDKRIEPGGESCFSLKVNSAYTSKTMSQFFVVTNGQVVMDREIDLSQSPRISECISSETFAMGENLVEINIGGDRLFYHVELAESVLKKTPEISIFFVEEDLVLLTVKNSDQRSYSPVEIYVNGKLDHKVFFSGTRFRSLERISLEDGKNEIRAEFLGVEAWTMAEKEPEFEMSPIIGVALISALLCAIAFLVFADKPLLKKAAYAPLVLFTILITIFFTLEAFGLLSSTNFVLAIALVTVIIIGIFESRFKVRDPVEKIDFRKQLKEISPLLLLLIGILVFSSFFFNMFTASYYSTWTSFYERQSITIAAAEAIPSIDRFSFLGTKPFGYMSGYFFVNAGVSWLSGLATQQSYAIIMILAQIAFMASALLFFQSFGFKGNRRYIAVLALFLGGFVFSDFSFNIRHVISYAMLLISAYLVREGKPGKAALMLGVGTFVQTPIFLMFLALLPIILTDKKQLRTAAKTILAGAIVALVLFSPTLLESGIPTQAEHNVWGYMWSIPLYGFFLDYLPLVVLIALFVAPAIYRRETKLNKFSQRVLAFLVLFVLVQLFVSYRINVVATIAFALFVGLTFPANTLKNKLSEYSLSALCGVGLALMFLVTISFYPVPYSVQNAFEFVKNNTSTSANFLNEPYLGHPFILLAQRKSSADLAVEYANEQMIRDSFSFIKTGDKKILEKYDAEYVVNRSIFLDEKPVGNNLWFEVLEFEELDKIYSNGLLFVHRERKKVALADPERGSPNIVVYGDSRTLHDRHREVFAQIIDLAPEAIVHVGDIVENGNSQADWDALDEIIGFDPETMTAGNDSLRIPYWPVLGNHEYNKDPGASNYLAHFDLPGNERWYSFDFENAHFAVLDSQAIVNGNTEDTLAQAEWLEADLQASQGQDFIFVSFHHPVYSESHHGDADEFWGQGANKTGINFVELFEKYGVDVVFEGHAHSYEKFYNNGIYYIVTGGGGASLSEQQKKSSCNCLQMYAAELHVMNVEINGKTASITAVKPDGTILDGPIEITAS